MNNTDETKTKIEKIVEVLEIFGYAEFFLKKMENAIRYAVKESKWNVLWSKNADKDGALSNLDDILKTALAKFESRKKTIILDFAELYNEISEEEIDMLIKAAPAYKKLTALTTPDLLKEASMISEKHIVSIVDEAIAENRK